MLVIRWAYILGAYIRGGLHSGFYGMSNIMILKVNKIVAPTAPQMFLLVTSR